MDQRGSGGERKRKVSVVDSLSRMHHRAAGVCNIIVTRVTLLVSKAAAAHRSRYDDRAPGIASERGEGGRGNRCERWVSVDEGEGESTPTMQ